MTITSICTVSISSNVTVHWYYSQERDSAGVNGSILPGIRQSISVDSRCVLAQVRVCFAELSITNIRTLDEGYYWCEVDVEESQLVQCPSSVLRISGCDRLSDCTMQTFRTNIRDFGCAVGFDIVRNNLTFVDLYSDSCSPKLTTPERVTTTQVDEEGSPSTVGMVLPTMTSETKPDFETTARPTTPERVFSTSTLGAVPTMTSNSSGSSIDSGRVKEISSTSVTDEAATSLPLAIILPVIGGGIGLLLFVVAILLALILMQSRKKRGRGKPSHL